jgi:hypothetical protein
MILAVFPLVGLEDGGLLSIAFVAHVEVSYGLKKQASSVSLEDH